MYDTDNNNNSSRVDSFSVATVDYDNKKKNDIVHRLDNEQEQQNLKPWQLSHMKRKQEKLLKKKQKEEKKISSSSPSTNPSSTPTSSSVIVKSNNHRHETKIRRHENKS